MEEWCSVGPEVKCIVRRERERIAAFGHHRVLSGYWSVTEGDKARVDVLHV